MSRRFARLLAWATVVFAVGRGSVVSAAPLDTVLAAFVLEAGAPLERVRLFVVRDGVADAYYIDRVRPGRIHIMKNPREDAREVVVVGARAWVRTTGGWERSPAGSVPAEVPSMAALFRGGLTEAVERPGIGGGRDIDGRMAWVNGAACDGKLLLRLGADRRPALLRWEGDCGGHPSRFREAFSYRGPLAIEPPI